MIKIVTHWSTLFNLAKQVGYDRLKLIEAEQQCQETIHLKKSLRQSEEKLKEYEGICLYNNSIINLGIRSGDLE